jgi:hypothetical protein
MSVIPKFKRLVFVGFVVTITMLVALAIRQNAYLPAEQGINNVIDIGLLYFLILSYLYACRLKDMNQSLAWAFFIFLINSIGFYFAAKTLVFSIIAAPMIAIIGIFLIAINLIFLIILSTKKSKPKYA